MRLAMPPWTTKPARLLLLLGIGRGRTEPGARRSLFHAGQPDYIRVDGKPS